MTRLEVINLWMADIVNTALKNTNIPLRITPHEVGIKQTQWKMDFTDKNATIDTVMVQVYAVQDHISEHAGGNPMACTKDDALFMLGSQWLLWMVEMGGSVDHPNYPMVQLIMQQWMRVYEAKGGDFKQFGLKS